GLPPSVVWQLTQLPAAARYSPRFSNSERVDSERPSAAETLDKFTRDTAMPAAIRVFETLVFETWVFETKVFENMAWTSLLVPRCMSGSLMILAPFKLTDLCAINYIFEGSAPKSIMCGQRLASIRLLQ